MTMQAILFLCFFFIALQDCDGIVHIDLQVHVVIR